MISVLFFVVIFIVAIIFLRNILFYIIYKITRPFHFIRMLLTNTLPGSKNGCPDEDGVEYVSTAQFVIFGIFGNILFWVLIVGGLMFALFGRPHGNQYAVHLADYEVGQEVYYKNKEVVTIESVEYNDIYKKNEYSLSNGASCFRKNLYAIKDRTGYGKTLIGRDKWLIDSTICGLKYYSAEIKSFFSISRMFGDLIIEEKRQEALEGVSTETEITTESTE